jgi:LL-diaminopimelate aminotransferase
MKIEESERLASIPPYLFAEIDRIINEKKAKGEDVISLGIGDPDLPTPSPVIEELYSEARNSQNHRYPSSYGLKMFKNAAAGYYKRRFGVELDPEKEMITIWGSKEGIANIAYAFINPGDIALVPDPGYLVYKIGTTFAGGQCHVMPLKEENGFLPEINKIDAKTAGKAKLMHINYPNNPTSATCDVNFFQEISDFANENEIIICHDNAYCDIYFNEEKKPSSFFNSKGSINVGLEFNSLSKTFNMTGWRIGFAAGNSRIIESLGKYKTNVDSGVFNAIQYAGAAALDNYEQFIDKNIVIYSKRRKLVFETLKKVAIEFYNSDATIYIWAKTPVGYDSASFSQHLLNNANVVVTPGSAFGKYGEGYFRISITLSDERLEEALNRIADVL